MRQKNVSIADVLERVLPPEAKKRIYSVELVRTRWRDVVGDELARRSEPEALSEGVLTVRVLDAAWGRMVYRLQEEIVPALNRALGMDLVRRINFTKRSALRHPMPTAAARAPAREPEPPESVVEAARDIEDPELRALVVRSAGRYLDARKARKRSSLP